jgi:membrane-associated phospholipid phosphatase
MTIEVVEWIQSFQNGVFDVFFNFISFLGEEYVYIVILSILFFAYDKKLGEFSGFTLFIAGALNSTLKGLVSAQRPFQKYPDRVTNLRPETSGGYSFPSGHTQMFSSFVFGLGFYKKHKKLLIGALFLGILMGLSRMYLGVHFLEDVLVALLLGIGTAYGLSILFDRYKDNDKALMNIYLITLALFLPFVIFLNYEDLFKTYGLMVGFTVGMYIEKNYVKFTMDVTWWKKGLRVLGGLVIMIAIMIGVDVLFGTFSDEGTTLRNILDGIRYGLMTLVGLGLYPFAFKKWNF